MRSVCRTLLQVARADKDWANIPSAARRLVALHGGGSGVRMSTQTDFTLRGRADAVLVGPGFLLAIEAKLGPVVTAAQLQRHRDTFDIPGDDADLHDCTWHELAHTAHIMQRDLPLTPVERFVLQQFEEYLRMNGFGGLTEEHLQYFVRQPAQRDDLVKDGIRRSLEGLMESLANEWDTTWRSSVGMIRQQDYAAWATISPAEPGKRASSVPHITVNITPSSLDILANIETERPYRVFQQAWQRDPNGFIAILKTLGSPWPPPTQHDSLWRMAVTRRIHRQAMMYDYWPAVDIVIATLAGWSDEQMHWFIDSMTQQPAGEGVPQISLLRSYPAASILHDADLGSRLAQDARALEPYFDWLGVAVR